MAIHPEIDRHLRFLAAAYTVSGTTATITSNLDHHQLAELVDKAAVTRHDVKLVGGSLQVVARPGA